MGAWEHGGREQSGQQAVDALATKLRAHGPLGISSALAHRAGLDAAGGGLIERATLQVVRASPYSALPGVVGALRTSWSEGLDHACLQATLDLAFELDLLEPPALQHVLQPLVASQRRIEALLQIGDAAPASQRLRAATFCRAVAMAAQHPRGLPHVLPGGADLFVRTLKRLFGDPSPAVGRRAAWATGLLARSVRALGALVERSLEGSAGLLRRRAAIARAAAAIAGDVDPEEVVHLLLEGACKGDVFARGSVVGALSQGFAMAPEQCCELAAALLAPPRTDAASAPALTSEALIAAAELATAPPNAPRQRALLEVAREGAKQLVGDEDPRLAFWFGERDARAATLMGLAGALLAEVAGAPGAAREASLALLGAAEDAVVALGAAGAQEWGEQLDHALDLVLLDANVARDALLASSAPERVDALLARWERLLFDLWAVRLARCDVKLASKLDARERLRRLASALDALPRRQEAHGATARVGFTTAAHATLDLVFRAARGPKERLFDQPLARAAAAALRPLLATDGLTAMDALGLCLQLERPGFVRALAGTMPGTPLGAALQRLCAVARAVKERRSGADAAHAAARSVVSALAFLAEAADDLPRDVDCGLGEGLRQLAIAAHATLEPGTRVLEPLAITWTAAADGLAPRRAGLTTRQDQAKATRPDRGEPLRKLFAGDPPASGAPGTAKLIARADAALPPALAGVVPLLAVARAGRPAQAAPAPPSSAMYGPGTVIGDFLVERKLGGGAMGHCLLARRRIQKHDPSAKLCVLKVPLASSNLELFRAEAMALIQLSAHPHPAIVGFQSFHAGARLPYLLMDYVRGETLGARLSAGALSPLEAVAISRALAQGVAVAHGASVPHYDLKPDNIILGERGPVLVDWGLAGARDMFAGTPDYMSPERWVVEDPTRRPSDALSPDVYALGCILYEMLSGAVLHGIEIGAEEQALVPRMERPAGVMGCFLVAADEALRWARIDRLERASPQLREILKLMTAVAPERRPTMATTVHWLETAEAELAAATPSLPTR